MDRYIGLDAHSASCTIAVVGPSGKRLQSQVLETNARALISFLKTIPKQRRLCLEEGTQANWLHEVLAPHVDEIVVTPGIRRMSGSKDDKRDAFNLAENLRIGAINTRVYKGLGKFGLLRELSRAYTMLVNDSVRVQNRIKSLYRSRGIPTCGKEIYEITAREKWLRKLPAKIRSVAGFLYQELDCVRDLKKQAEKEMLAEAQKHSISRILKTCPGMGVIRVAQILSIVVTPYRFSSKRSFWAYAGLAIVMRSSSDWTRAGDGSWARLPVQQTRGLNRNGNRALKQIFKGAATTVIGYARNEDPLYRHYQQLLNEGTRPNLAKLTIARQIASIILSMWRSEEVYNPAKLKKAA
ncbi:MAG: transposase [Candidatus Eisenbacteria bacterium]|uniref:Transposase n=1 Tax=Eiseniibacteriota bacterium TaxID=2212470 RepID=A0A948RXW8_UNCEI|nr:transposase [Candidatus Eisenbacteria bacterium]MBU1948898.1 transposase [Candidatus Eisenbacteria bacterium]MBU2691619.1 transposase [Candidatus Eisenbacteria bacterium]